MATVDKMIHKHGVNIVVGPEVNENKSSSLSGTANGFRSDAVKLLSAATNAPTLFEGKSHSGSLSYFSRLNYSFDRTYNLSLSFRRDGSSKFGDNNKYANFWALGASWNLHRDFFKDSKSLSNLKARFSIGTSGNDFIGDFASQSLYQFRINYNGVNTPTLSRGENAFLTWEKSNSTNVGLDVGFFKNRVTASVDYYVRTTKDLLNDVPIPLTSGFGTLVSNIGEFENKGVEVAVSATTIENQDFSWNTTLNFSSNKGKVISLTDDRNLIFKGRYCL